MSFILFDVGANWGTDSLEKTRVDPNIQCYAFEPTPELARHLREKSHEFSNRYFVNEVALSNFDGTANFNVSAHADWGVSSLLDFGSNVADTWAGRTDFFVDRTIDVTVSRFDTWYRAVNPPFHWIDFFHCDTQGSDLAVLQGMGELVELIRAGCVETPHTPDVRLYAGQHTQEEMRDFLAEHGFEIYRVEAQQNEDNLYFRRRS